MSLAKYSMVNLNVIAMADEEDRKLSNYFLL